jgi:hypothetical protein
MAEKKRDTTRVEFHTRAILVLGGKAEDQKSSRESSKGGKVPGGKEISGRVENLSLKGMFLVPDAPVSDVEVGHVVSATIRLAGTASDLSIELNGEIVRRDEEGIGIRFTDMEFDTFVHLRNIVAYNTGDEEKIMEEFSETFEENEE